MLHLHGAYLLWKSMFDTLSDKNNIFFQEKCFFSSWDFILKQWRRGQHWRKLKVRFRFTETPFLPNHRTLPKPCFCRTSKPKPKFRSYTTKIGPVFRAKKEVVVLFSARNHFRRSQTWGPGSPPGGFLKNFLGVLESTDSRWANPIDPAGGKPWEVSPIMPQTLAIFSLYLVIENGGILN